MCVLCICMQLQRHSGILAEIPMCSMCQAFSRLGQNQHREKRRPEAEEVSASSWPQKSCASHAS